MTDSLDGNIELFNFLKNAEFFNQLHNKALWPLANLAILRHYKVGELLIAENSDSAGIFVIKTGKVKIYKTAKDGSEVFIAELLPGQIIGEVSIINNSKTTASAVAMEDLEGIYISEQDFASQLQSYPEMGVQLITVLAKSYIAKVAAMDT